MGQPAARAGRRVNNGGLDLAAVTAAEVTAFVLATARASRKARRN
jgi:hypothetical protein